MEGLPVGSRAGPRHLMILDMPPVWRSQLITDSSRSGGNARSSSKQVKIRPSGEKISALYPVDMSWKDSKVWSRWRVAESSTSTTDVPFQVIAMNLLHGDHTTDWNQEGRAAAAELGSHDIGAPYTSRMKGWACDSYSFRTIESFGATTSAE